MPNCPLCGTQKLEEHTFCYKCGTSLTGMTGQLSPYTILEERYIVVETLGRGGMGAVYKALDQRLNNMPVAIKEMSTKAVGQGNLQAAVGAFKKGWTYYSDNQLNSNKKQNQSDSWGSTSGTSTGQSSQSNLAGTSNQNKTTDTQQIQSLLNKWVSTVKEGNISSHVPCYADYLDVYFDRNNITKDDLYKDKQTMFTQYSSIYMTIDNIQINFVNSNEASATFLKKWDARGKETFSGEETEELKLRKYNGEWKIYSEIEQNIFWVIKNGKRIM